MTNAFTQPTGIACHLCQEVTHPDNARDEMVFFSGDDVVFVSEQYPDWSHALCGDCYEREEAHAALLANTLPASPRLIDMSPVPDEARIANLKTERLRLTYHLINLNENRALYTPKAFLYAKESLLDAIHAVDRQLCP